MHQYVVAYIVSLVLFVALDVTWLMTMGGKLYRQTLGDILLQDIRFGPAIAFYLLYPAGLVIFGVAPALREGSIAHALLMGGLFGLFAYATYELTNYATLRNWTLQITVIDVVYGLIVSGAVSAVAAMVTLSIAAWIGGSR
jgi:uncharacterized membrane protein